MTRLLRKAPVSLALAVGLALLLQSAALAAIVPVSIVDNAFNPATVKPKQGDSVQWTNTGNNNHTTTSNGCTGTGTQGVGLWCSPVLSDNQQFSQVFNVSAKYPYFCTIHPSMTGTVQVNMKAQPKNGGLGTQFNIIWAKTNIPAGFNADIQIKRPGSTQFVNWMIDRTGTQVSAMFTPDAGTGVYQFKSRLQNSATAGASSFSKAVSITVS
jgi:plastocyanin